MYMVDDKIVELESDWQDPYPEQELKYPKRLALIRFGFQTLGRVFPGWAARLAYYFFSTPRLRARHKVSDPVLEQARLFEVLYGKRILKAYSWGDGDRTILLVHGWESRGTALRSFVPSLVEKGFRVVAFDGPAHGNSAGKQTNLIDFGGAVRAIMHHLGGVYGVITHSFGGASTVYALGHLVPDLHVSKLVMVAVPASMERVYRNAVQTLRLPNSVAYRFRAILEDLSSQSLEDLELPVAFTKIDVEQALLVHDSEDRVVPIVNAEMIVASWPNAQLLKSKGYGHFRLMKNPDLVRWVCDWMAAEEVSS